jgi:hypothetical protein
VLAKTTPIKGERGSYSPDDQLLSFLKNPWSRHTFATNHLRDGGDMRTVRAWLGHGDIKSTMVYLKSIWSKDAARKVNSGELASYVA